MNYKQYLLIKLAEECNEIAQAAIKTALFGETSVDPREDTGETNLDKLLKELLDSSAVVEELGLLIESKSSMIVDPDAYIDDKKKKLQMYFGLAQKEFSNE